MPKKRNKSVKNKIKEESLERQISKQRSFFKNMLQEKSKAVSFLKDEGKKTGSFFAKFLHKKENKQEDKEKSISEYMLEATQKASQLPENAKPYTNNGGHEGEIIYREKTFDSTKELRGFIKVGIPLFDKLFDNGIPKGSSVLIAGGPGTGKTILCLQILEYAATHGERCLYMSFEEPESRLRQHMHDFGWNPEKLEKQGLLVIKRYDPFDITRSIEALLTKAKKELLIDVEPVFFPANFKPTRIVLDSMSAVAAAFVGREDSYRIYIEQLFRFFEKLGATSFLITETEHPESTGLTKSGIEGFLADGIILLYNLKIGGNRQNAIEILKMRGENFQKKIVKMEIKPKAGIKIYPDQKISSSFSIG